MYQARIQKSGRENGKYLNRATIKKAAGISGPLFIKLPTYITFFAFAPRIPGIVAGGLLSPVQGPRLQPIQNPLGFGNAKFLHHFHFFPVAAQFWDCFSRDHRNGHLPLCDILYGGGDQVGGSGNLRELEQLKWKYQCSYC